MLLYAVESIKGHDTDIKYLGVSGQGLCTPYLTSPSFPFPFPSFIRRDGDAGTNVFLYNGI